MKFDPKKPHGLIINHPWARYEQDGVLFDWSGNSKDHVETEAPKQISKQPEKTNGRDFALENAKAFLETIMADGELARSAVFKECDANNQNWEKVKTAFADMGGEVFKRRNVIFWKLKPE